MTDDTLFERFRAFYAELTALKRRALAGDWVFSAVEAVGDNGAPLDGIDAASQRLVGLLQGGGEPKSPYERDAQYVMAALADEVFLHALEWEGKAAWRDTLIEERLFKTYVAGERFFVRLDELLARDDPSRRSLASIYLMALAAGFKGKYSGGDEGRAIADYKNRLRVLLGREDLNPVTRPLCADAYPLKAPGDADRLADIRPQLWLFAAGLLAVLTVSQVVRLALSADINAIVGWTG